jgi:glycosyltransferase involved in cell wall biosynthesis
MRARSLRIAWLGSAPVQDAGAAGVTTELLHGLAQLGHRIDCFFPSAGQEVPTRLAQDESVTFIWGTSRWQWNRWYSRGRIPAFASGLIARSFASLRLRREIARRHRREPYDLIFQNSSIESLAVPRSVERGTPLVIRPDTHIAGELRHLIAERRHGIRSQPSYKFMIVAAIMSLRALVQRVRVRRARLLICISGVFRDHLVHDYGFPIEHTVVVPNPVRLERFTQAAGRAPQVPPVVLVLGRIAVRKGIEDVVAVAGLLRDRNVDARIRVVGGPSLWSDYTKLLDDLPPEIAEYAGAIPSSEVPRELATSDLLLQASKYEPFALTVAEALAAGVPVVGTDEVGAIENVDRVVAARVAPGDVQAMAAAIVEMLDRLRKDPEALRSRARQEAERLFAPPTVCAQISAALEELLAETDGPSVVSAPAHAGTAT